MSPEWVDREDAKVNRHNTASCDQSQETRTHQQFLTVAAGKRLVAKGVLALPAVEKALLDGTVVVMAGSTNGYVVEELLRRMGQAVPFSRTSFVRGVTTAPGRSVKARAGAYGSPSTEANPSAADKAAPFPGDLVVVKGIPQFGKTIFDVAGELKAGDVVLKGANAVNLEDGQAGILIGHPEMGTIAPILQAVVGRRVTLVLPVGLEKRVADNLCEVARLMNAPQTAGVRFMPVAGEVVTELEAIPLLTGATARLVAAGGVCGAEGGVWLAVTGTGETLAKADLLLRSLSSEPAWEG